MEININDERMYFLSNELHGILTNVLCEDKLFGIIFTENEFKVVETEDFFDVRLEEVLRNNLTIIIDTNLFIAARDIYKYSNIKTEDRSYFATLLAYANFIDAAFDPTICLYEVGNRENHKAVDDLYKFRVVDNLSFETKVELCCGNIDSISQSDWDEARKRTRKMNESEKKENYNKSLTHFKQNYPFMLKATILLRREGVSLFNKIKYFFDWVLEDFITNSEAITFALYIFFHNGGQIIKKYNTNDYSEIIRLIRNATWDVTYISYLKNEARKTPHHYYLLTSNDKNLISAAKYFFSPDDTRINNLFGKKKNDVRKMIENINNICAQPGRENLIKDRLDNIDETIVDLENELRISMVKE